jgi:hypothetical protein
MSRGAGVGIYVKLDLKYTTLPQKYIYLDCIFESIFIELESSPNTKSIIGSVYRHGTKHLSMTSTQQYKQFVELLSNICNDQSALNNHVYTLGDPNLDVLQYSISTSVTDYVFLRLPTKCKQSYKSNFEFCLIN